MSDTSGQDEVRVASWYGVRTIHYWVNREAYEERVTMWFATSFEEAIEMAEKDAEEYVPEESGYVALAQAYETGIEHQIEQGDEVFSLIRYSKLKPKRYLDRFFDTGAENGKKIPG